MRIDPTPELTPDEHRAAVRIGRDICWRNGNLRHLLHSGQHEVYDTIAKRNASREVMEISRKFGKTWLCVVLAAEPCLKTPGVRVVYGAPSLKHLEEFVLPVMRRIAHDAPADCEPEYNAHNGHWTFPNGSWVHLFGADDMNKAERGRGPEAVRALFDEAGFSPVLQYVLSDVFKPSLMLTRGQTILSSTPSSEPDHPFTAIAEIAEGNGTYFNRTVWDNPMMSEAMIRGFIADDARDNGMTEAEYEASSTFRREYMAERVVDRTLVVMGEDWTTTRESAMMEVERPQFFDAYESLDIGGIDPHAVLFGYWHFQKSWLVIEDELLLREGQNSAQLVEAWKAKSKELWGTNQWDGTLRILHEERADPVFMLHLPQWARERVQASATAPLQPYVRICDSPTQIATDLAVLHGIACIPTEKVDKRWYVNEFRVLMRQGRVKIHPRCRNLDRHLRQTVWANHRQSDYKRKNGEHGDLLDDAVYMARNIRKERNPTPLNYGLDPATTWVRNRPKPNPLKLAMSGRRK